MKASSQGFIGCLSSVQFNHVAPLKAALFHSNSAPITVKGHFTESNCGSLTAADSTSSETTHSFAGSKHMGVSYCSLGRDWLYGGKKIRFQLQAYPSICWGSIWTLPWISETVDTGNVFLKI